MALSEDSQAPSSPISQLQEAVAASADDPAQIGSALFDGAASRPSGPGGPSGIVEGVHRAPSPDRTWNDRYTGQLETEASKIRRAVDIALRSPIAYKIRGQIPYNIHYRVEDAPGISYVAKTQGDDPEKPAETAPLVIFTAQALWELSPQYLAARLAGLWARHLYRNELPQSAEKTYVEGSIFIRVFEQMSASTKKSWDPYHKDYKNQGKREAYRHFVSWTQGLRFHDVRQGPYFQKKIKGAEGDPTVYTDARGRRTLYKRAQAGEISVDAFRRGQTAFDTFMREEPPFVSFR